MKIQGWLAAGLAAALLCAPVVHAASSGSGDAATCKDGTSWTGKSHSGACRGHGGVQSWSDSAAAAPAQTNDAASTSTHKSHSKKSGSAASTGDTSSSSSMGSSSAAETGSTTATCKDGTSWSGKSHSGACRGHGGVQGWGAAPMAAAPAAATASKSGTAKSTASPAAPAANTAAANATCKDGTSWSGKSHSGACRGHGGVKSWSGEDTTAASTPMAPAPAAAPAQPQSPMQTAQTHSHATSGMQAQATPAPGGGAGKVWVNPSSKTYHCQGTKWYGTTKAGSYMSESQAKAQGYHADHGKACT